jgi:hypothetical protein
MNFNQIVLLKQIFYFSPWGKMNAYTCRFINLEKRHEHQSNSSYIKKQFSQHSMILLEWFFSLL